MAGIAIYSTRAEAQKGWTFPVAEPPMDPVSLTYYAIVCGCLAVASPRLNPLAVRVIVGVAVGLLAAVLLPVLRRATGL
jgi:hypothetical protein